MQRVSYKTLFLLLMLLGLIIVQQRTAKAVCLGPDVVWLAEDPNNSPPEWIGPPEPWAFEEASDPNEPGPERV